MNTLLLALAVFTAVPDGSLLFLENTSDIVEHHTGSPITHIAIILYEEGDPWVYEAEPPKVRRVRLEKYIENFNKLKRHRKRARMWIVDPRGWGVNLNLAAMKKCANSQLGRRYSVRSWIEDRPTRGIHCGEFVLYVLSCGGAGNISTRPWNETPGSLWAIFDKCRRQELVEE